MRDKKYFRAGYISEWVVINFTDERGLDQIMRGLARCCSDRGTLSLPDTLAPITVIVGVVRQRGFGQLRETGGLHLPRILPGNPQAVEVHIPMAGVDADH